MCYKEHEPSRIARLFLRGLNKKNSMLKKFVLKKILMIEIPKSSAKLHRYDSKVRKLYHARYKCNNKRDPKIINLNKMAMPKRQGSISILALVKRTADVDVMCIHSTKPLLPQQDMWESENMMR